MVLKSRLVFSTDQEEHIDEVRGKVPQDLQGIYPKEGRYDYYHPCHTKQSRTHLTRMNWKLKMNILNVVRTLRLREQL